MNFLIKKITSMEDYGFAAMIRTKVFVIEQACPPLEEFDALDDEAVHYLGWCEGLPISTCRVIFCDENLAKIGRIATLKESRGKGFASSMLQKIIKDIEDETKINEIKLSAQVNVKEFYEKLGFEAYGEVYEEASIPHQMMRKGIGN